MKSKMYVIKKTLIYITCLLFVGQFSYSFLAGDDNNHKYVLDKNGKRPQPVVAVDNVCAWPNLTVLNDGTIIASIHNHPSHLKHPADVDCWATRDGGKTWVKRGTPSPRGNERAARGNVAAGLANNGDMVVISSGWSDPTLYTRGSILPAIISRSTDGGYTWVIGDKVFPGITQETANTNATAESQLIPFGDILKGGDGDLRVGLYSASGKAFVYRSSDDGKTWCEPVALNKDAVIYEPALFHLGKNNWLAAARLDGLDLYTSNDDAKTWTLQKKLTGKAQHPAHFVRLKDGRVLLSYSNRLVPGGIDVRFSDDEGHTWSHPYRVVGFQGDGGYPSCVQLPDGQLLTVYYAENSAGYSGYHMGAIVWDPKMTCGH